MDSALEYILSDTRGLLQLRPFVPSIQGNRSPRPAMLIRYGKLPGVFDRGPGSLTRVNERGGMGRQVVKSRLPALKVG
jgi:hypothetical protein